MTPMHLEDATFIGPSGLATTKADQGQTDISETGARTTFPQEDAAEMIDQRRQIADELVEMRQKVIVEHELKFARSLEERKRAEQIMVEMERDSSLGRQ